MIKYISVLFVMLLFCMTACTSRSIYEVESASGNLSFKIELEEETESPLFSIFYMGSKVIDESSLGMSFRSGIDLFTDTKITSIQTIRVDTSWNPLYGEKSNYTDCYTEGLINFSTKYDAEIVCALRVRTYDEGVAFRYEFTSKNHQIVKEELTTFNVSDNSSIWSSAYAEGPTLKTKISKIKSLVERPVLVQPSDSVFLALGEASLVDFARMKFEIIDGKYGQIGVNLNGNNNYSDDYTPSDIVIKKGHFKTSWRYVMVGESAGQLLENNYFILNLNEPNKIPDANWIKPGKVIREVTLTTEGGKACVDFAVKNNLQYILFDAGWYGNEFDYASDASTFTVDPKRSTGPLELLEVINYAKERNIKVILYVNDRGLDKQLDKILPLYKEWGVAGIKCGFVNVGTQKQITRLHDVVKKAAENNLMVTIQEEYRPTGFSRTYPNLMTQEGMQGDEQSVTNEMVINTIFTRMIAGAGDQTNCYLAERVKDKMGSNASQMAKVICIYSPWQFLFWYDRPEGSPIAIGGAGDANGVISDLPDLEFYNKIPTVWDDTKVIDGYPGEHVLIARKNGNSWFIGGITGTKERTFNLKLDFLKEDEKYEAIMFSDDKSLKTSTNVKIERLPVKKDLVLSKEVEKNNGMAIIINQI